VAIPIPAEDAGALASTFKAMADPARIQLLHMLKLAEEPICVCDFTAALELGQPTISHHLAKLKEAGFVNSEKRGIWSFHQLNPAMPPAARAVLAFVP
jgi:ArsR family transcriptional regulator